jgi:hypothetical protein
MLTPCHYADAAYGAAMPVLRNRRHERFARLRCEGRSATESYKLAGYSPDKRNAHRLTTYDTVQQREGELMQRTGKRHEITVDGIVGDLETACEEALRLGQPSVVVSAQSLKMRLAGLDKERIEITEMTGFASCSTPAEIVAKLCEGEDAHKLLDGLRALVAEIEAHLGDRALVIEPK